MIDIESLKKSFEEFFDEDQSFFELDNLKDELTIKSTVNEFKVLLESNIILKRDIYYEEFMTETDMMTAANPPEFRPRNIYATSAHEDSHDKKRHDDNCKPP